MVENCFYFFSQLKCLSSLNTLIGVDGEGIGSSYNLCHIQWRTCPVSNGTTFIYNGEYNVIAVISHTDPTMLTLKHNNGKGRVEFEYEVAAEEYNNIIVANQFYRRVLQIVTRCFLLMILMTYVWRFISWKPYEIRSNHITTCI